MIKKNKSWNIPKQQVCRSPRLRQNPCPKNSQKQQLLPTSGNFICQCLHCNTDFFDGFYRPHDCLKLYHSLSVELSASVKIRGPTCQIFAIADNNNSRNGGSLKLGCIYIFYIKTHLFYKCHTYFKQCCVVSILFPNTKWRNCRKF